MHVNKEPVFTCWVRSNIFKYCGYSVTDEYVSVSGVTHSVVLVSGLYWSKFLEVARCNLGDLRARDLAMAYETIDGREHSQLASLIYGEIRREAEKSGRLILPNGTFVEVPVVKGIKRRPHKSRLMQKINGTVDSTA